jgi:tetratricopeptide (TPR) repeat protein
MNSKLKKIRKLNQQAWSLCRKDGPRAIELARQAQSLLSSCPQSEPIDEFECLKTQTYCLDMLSKPEEALPIGLKAKYLAEKIGDKYLISSMQNLLGRIYWHIDDYPASLEYYINGLKLLPAEDHPELEISLINGLGLVQYGLENYTESLGYFKTCLEKSNDNDLDNRADANNNIAYVMHILGRNQEAVEYAAAALDLFIHTENYVGKLHTLHSLGAIHLALGNYDEAMSFLQEGRDLSRKNNSELLELTYTLEISRIHQAWGNFNRAEEELLQALQTAEKINSLTNISLIHEQLIEIYKGKQDYK